MESNFCCYYFFHVALTVANLFVNQRDKILSMQSVFKKCGEACSNADDVKHRRCQLSTMKYKNNNKTEWKPKINQLKKRTTIRVG